MKGKVQIINMALVGLGETPVNSPDEGKFSRIAATFYDAALEETLRAHPWNFAVKRQLLVKSATAPVSGYGAAFPFPADCLRVLEVDQDDYRVEGRFIVANADSLALRYIARVDDATVWDASFAATFAANLTAKITYPITKSTSLRDSNLNYYAQLLQQARSVDAQEEPAEQFEESVFIRARG